MNQDESTYYEEDVGVPSAYQTNDDEVEKRIIPHGHEQYEHIPLENENFLAKVKRYYQRIAHPSQLSENEKSFQQFFTSFAIVQVSMIGFLLMGLAVLNINLNIDDDSNWMSSTIDRTHLFLPLILFSVLFAILEAVLFALSFMGLFSSLPFSNSETNTNFQQLLLKFSKIYVVTSLIQVIVGFATFLFIMISLLIMNGHGVNDSRRVSGMVFSVLLATGAEMTWFVFAFVVSILQYRWLLLKVQSLEGSR